MKTHKPADTLLGVETLAEPGYLTLKLLGVGQDLLARHVLALQQTHEHLGIALDDGQARAQIMSN